MAGVPLGNKNYRVSPKAALGPFVEIGEGSVIWHHCNIYGTEEEPVIIGKNTQIGLFSEIKPGVRVGDNCRLQSFGFIPNGVTIGNWVFIGPRVTFTNDRYPSAISVISGDWKLCSTMVEDYVSLGAEAIIGPGIRIARGAFIGQGANVIKDGEPCAVLIGNPARKIGDVREEPFRSKLPHVLGTGDE